MGHFWLRRSCLSRSGYPEATAGRTAYTNTVKKKYNVAGIPEYYTKKFVILHENRKKV